MMFEEDALFELLDLVMPYIGLPMIFSFLVAGNMIAGRRQCRDGNGSWRRLFFVSVLFALIEFSPVTAVPVIAMITQDLSRISATLFVASVAVLINLCYLVQKLRPRVVIRDIDQPNPLVTDAELLDRFSTICSEMGITPPTLRIHYALNRGTTNYGWAEGICSPIVVVTDDLVPVFEPIEIDAVIAHEIAHVANGSLWIQAMTLPFSLLLATFATLLVSPDVAFALAFAVWTGLYRLTSRWYESMCDRMAGEIVGYAQMASVLTKLHSSFVADQQNRLEKLTSAFSTHPHRDVRIRDLLERISKGGQAPRLARQFKYFLFEDSEPVPVLKCALSHLSADEVTRAAIPFSPKIAGEQTHIATTLLCVWLLMICCCVTAAWATEVMPWISLLLVIICIGPWVLENWKAWRDSDVFSQRTNARSFKKHGVVTTLGRLAFLSAVMGAFLFAPVGIEIPLFIRAALGASLLALLVNDRSPQVDRLLGQVRHAIQMKQFEKVIELSQQNAKIVARSPHLRHNLALANGTLGRRFEAIEILESVRKDFPEFKLSWLLLAETYLQERNLPAALEVTTGFASALPNDPLGHLLTARIQRLLERYDQAETAVHQASKLAPGSCHVTIELAALCLDRGETARAVELIDQAIGPCHEDSYAQLIKAKIDLRTKPIDQARPGVERILSKIRQDPRNYFLADVEELAQELAARSSVEA